MKHIHLLRTVFSSILLALCLLISSVGVLVSAAEPPAAGGGGVVGRIKTGLEGAAGPAGYAAKDTKPPEVIFGNIIGAALSVLGLVLLAYILYGGFKWMTAEGPEDVKKAKDIIKNAIIGLVIIVAAYAISSFVLNQLSKAITGGGSV